MKPGWEADKSAVGGGLSRRDFLKAAVCTVAGASAMVADAAGVTGAVAAATARPPGRVVRVVGASSVADGKINAAVAEKMVNLAVMRLQEKKDPAAAWKDLFSAKDVVGIKVNSQGGPLLSTSRAVVDAIIRALTGIGVPENNIIVWDGPRERTFFSGFEHNSGASGLRCLNAHDAGYEPDCGLASGGRTEFTRLLTREITALINAPVLKTHGQTGITFALKNIAMGSIREPSSHCRNSNILFKSIGAICARDEVRRKQRLVVGDALLGLCAGGPGPSRAAMWEEKSVAVARDPVAIDAWGLAVINAERRRRGQPPAGAGRRGWNNAAHIQLAAGLGVGSVQYALTEDRVE